MGILRTTRAADSDSMIHHILFIIVAYFVYAENDCHCGLARRIRFGKGDRVQRIRGGVEAEVGEFPWQVAFFRPDYINMKKPSFLCGGSLISDHWILTAAHCKIRKEDEIRLGDHNILIGIEAREYHGSIGKIIKHPQYSKVVGDFDFSLVRLKEKIDWADQPNIRPVCLPRNKDETFTGRRATVSGWGVLGYINGNSIETASLQEIGDEEIMDNEVCNEIFSKVGISINISVYGEHWVTESKVCTSFREKKGPCKGDSGGPLIVANGKMPALHYELVGVASRSTCGDINYAIPVVYSRVTAVLDWILEETGADQATCPPLGTFS